MMLLTKVAIALAKADRAPIPVEWSELSKADQRAYENMAAAAIASRIVIENLDPYGLNGPPRG